MQHAPTETPSMRSAVSLHGAFTRDRRSTGVRRSTRRKVAEAPIGNFPGNDGGGRRGDDEPIDSADFEKSAGKSGHELKDLEEMSGGVRKGDRERDRRVIREHEIKSVHAPGIAKGNSTDRRGADA